jgi:predicted outer membrane repeat protein
MPLFPKQFFALACALGAAGCAFPRAGSPAFFEVTVGLDAADDDIGDGRCRSTLPSGACTLRAALQESNARTDSNTVRLGRRTHRLTLPDRLAVTHRVRVMGANTTETVIDGMDRGASVFVFDGGLAWVHDLTITRGGGPSEPRGGGISIRGGATVSLANVVIRDNEAFTGGGGIYVQNGSLILIDSSVSENRATGAFCGGIWLEAGTTLTMDRSTIEGNTSNRCGGIYNFGRITVTNSTISGNSSDSDSRGTGGIINIGTARLNNVTIYRNTTNAIVDPESSGGLLATAAATTSVSNTIIAGNSDGRAWRDCTGTVTSGGYNLIENAADCRLTGSAAGNITDRDPQLSPLALNFGGPTRSHLPASTSPAIGAGHPQVGPGITPAGRCEVRDQARRIRQLTGDGRRCDIGSIEGR